MLEEAGDSPGQVGHAGHHDPAQNVVDAGDSIDGILDGVAGRNAELLQLPSGTPTMDGGEHHAVPGGTVGTVMALQRITAIRLMNREDRHAVGVGGVERPIQSQRCALGAHR